MQTCHSEFGNRATVTVSPAHPHQMTQASLRAFQTWSSVSLSDPGSTEKTAPKRKFPSPPHSSNGHSPQDSSTSPIKKKKKPGLLNSSNKEQVTKPLRAASVPVGWRPGGSGVAWGLGIAVAGCLALAAIYRKGSSEGACAKIFRSVLRIEDRAICQIPGVGVVSGFSSPWAKTAA